MKKNKIMMKIVFDISDDLDDSLDNLLKIPWLKNIFDDKLVPEQVFVYKSRKFGFERLFKKML